MTSEPGSAAMEPEDRRTPCENYPWPWSYDDYADLVLSSTGHCINQSDDVIFKFLIAKVETLTRERDEAREALKPFAATALAIDQNRPAVRLDDDEKVWVRVGDLRHARAALAGGKQE